MRLGCGILVLGLCAGLPSTVRGDPPNGIRAVVHDAVITSDEVDRAIESTAKRLVAQYGRQPEVFQSKLNELSNSKQEELISRLLILHEFKTAGYNLPESVIDELVQEKIRSEYRDRSTLTKSLQEEGLTYEKFRQQIRDQFVIIALRQKNIASEIIISPHKIETYYQAHKSDYKVEDEVKLRMIVLNKSASADRPDARKLADEIVVKLDEGASFEEMAGVYSQRTQRDPGPETFQTSRLRKELAEVVGKMKAGQRSEVIDTPEACYLVKVEEVNPGHVRTLSEVREEIEKDLLTQERARLEKQWIERLKKKTFIRYF